MLCLLRPETQVPGQLSRLHGQTVEGRHYGPAIQYAESGSEHQLPRPWMHDRVVRQGHVDLCG